VLLQGAIAGFVATFPMTVVMLLLHRLLPRREQYPLPPRQITEEISERVGVNETMDEPEQQTVTLAAHFAYGALAGMLFIPLARMFPMAGVPRGMLYGLLVWSASYLGWLPAAGILPPATREPVGRNFVMIAAHLVWGTILALVFRRLRIGTDLPGLRSE